MPTFLVWVFLSCPTIAIATTSDEVTAAETATRTTDMPWLGLVLGLATLFAIYVLRHHRKKDGRQPSPRD